MYTYRASACSCKIVLAVHKRSPLLMCKSNSMYPQKCGQGNCIQGCLLDAIWHITVNTFFQTLTGLYTAVGQNNFEWVDHCRLTSHHYRLLYIM